MRSDGRFSDGPPETLEELLEEIVDEFTVEAGDDDDRFGNFLDACRRNMAWPCEAFVIGEPVLLTKLDYEGNWRRGLIAVCRRSDGSEYEIAASEVVVSPAIEGARYLAAYRKWMGVEPFPVETAASVRTRRRRPAPAAISLDLRVESAVLSVKQTTARCRLLGSGQVVTLRAKRSLDLVPGEIAVVVPHKQWRYSGSQYLSGAVESRRLDVTALGLVPLKLRDRTRWDPLEDHWREKDEPIPEWAKPILARGPRWAFEMEQVLPGENPEDPFSDPIIESNDLKEAGQTAAARRLLMETCEADLRCLDAHAHLGNLVFDSDPAWAIRHYEVGVRIGELSLGGDFDGVLPWRRIDNRPFLRCLHGFAWCLWRLGRFEEAASVFDRLLWLNPSDNQEVRFMIDEVRAGQAWKSGENDAP